MNVLTVVGTRPEAIKMALLARALSNEIGTSHRLVSTGQHADLVDGALSLFGVRTDVKLKVMRPGQSLSALSGRLFNELGSLLAGTKPDLVIVHGDTTSAFVATMAAFYQQIPVAHVEAGLRSGSLKDPFPEEFNRKSIDQLSDVCFAPTELNKENLLRESKPLSSILVTGNTVVDALLDIRRRLDEDSELRARVDTELSQFGVSIGADRRFVVVTCHRRESFGEPLLRILASLGELARCFPDFHFIFPVHPNPSVRNEVRWSLGKLPNVILTEPMSYEAMVLMMSKCSFVMTDSGGLQEEAPTFGKPVLVLRHVTERQEGVVSGNLELVGTATEKIISSATRLIKTALSGDVAFVPGNPFGDGNSVPRITRAIKDRFGL